MFFGPVNVADAKGAILVHTVRLNNGSVLPKGRVISSTEIVALESAGRREIVVARLEAGEVHEDTAAAALARAAAGSGLRVSVALAGRCSLHAENSGVLVVNRKQVDRVNAIDESMTFATAAPWSLVDAGALIATVKVIPFAVKRHVLDSCVAAAGTLPVVSVAPLHPMSAGLVLTHLPEQAPAALNRAGETQRLRVERLGGRVQHEIRCLHEVSAVARATRSLLEAGCSPVLILGAEATVDRRDVVPAAIEQAGGVIEHFGIPVDPGHLLVLGRHNEVPIISLPGCALSVKPNGIDLMLERISAGIEVSSRAITEMGVGGLLASTARSSLRERRDSVNAKEKRIGAVVLAAGLSRRLGDANKMLVEINHTPMVTRVVDAVLASVARPVIVVTGYQPSRIREVLHERDVIFVHNPSYEEGLATSLRAGIAALIDTVDGAVICLGDMPHVRGEHIDALISRFDARTDCSICVPVYNRRRGNPVLWAARFFPELTQLSGDTGARALLISHAEAVCDVEVGDDGVHIDVDTLEMLEAARAKDSTREPEDRTKE